MEVVEIKVERGSSVVPALVIPDAATVDVTIVDVVDPATAIDADGWEIGALSVLLAAGVETVNGIDERRIARVRAVLAALEAAR
ncbi:MAG: hypothetical protein ABI239_12580 [Aquihabitans sp.]